MLSYWWYWSCLTGCKAGYQGDTCKTRELTNHLILRYAPIMRFLIYIKLDPGFRVCFFFAQRYKFPVIVLDTLMIMTCTNMVRWLKYKYIALNLQKERKIINMSKNLVENYLPVLVLWWWKLGLTSNIYNTVWM